MEWSEDSNRRKIYGIACIKKGNRYTILWGVSIVTKVIGLWEGVLK